MAFSFNWENRVDGQDYVMAGDVNNLALGIQESGDYTDAHISDQSNPHGVTKIQLGLGSVDNTSDANKPVSIAQQAALNEIDNRKVEKEAGKGLSTNDFDNAYKAQLDGLNDDLAAKVNTADIVDDLITGGSAVPLSAKQGTVLQASKADQPYQQHIQTDGGFHVEDSAGGLVADASISGNAIQNGTPTPEAPVTPLCLKAGDKIDLIKANHLNINKSPDSSSNVTASLENEILTLTSNSAASAARYVIPLIVSPNQRYYISLKAKQSVTYDVNNSSVLVRTGSSSGTVLKSAVLAKNTEQQQISFYFDSGVYGLVYFWFYVRQESIADQPATITYSDVMVSPQNIPYEPYTNPTTLTVPCDMWKWDKLNVLTGDVAARSVVISSYNNEPITGEYVSSTGGLDTGAYVVYDSGIETMTHYTLPPITLPQGTVNMVVESSNGVLPSEVDMLYRQDLQAFVKSIADSIYDTLATNITDLQTRVAALENA